MLSPVRCGLSLMCFTMLLFPVAQVRPQCYMPQPKTPGPEATCCMTISNAPIEETVNACVVQEENTFSNCKRHAYILSNVNNTWCVDPRAPWLQRRLRRLQKRGKCCQII